jgi:hypothetical protein
MTELKPVEEADKWLLPMSGQQVTRCCADYAAVTFLLLNGVQIDIESPFILTEPGGHEYSLNPDGDAVSLAPILAARRQAVQDGTAFKNGRLLIHMKNGGRISVPADENYEAWTVSGPRGLRIVSTPGGDLSVWMPRNDEPN